MNHSSLKILWFSNTPASGSEYLNLENTSGGWLSSLDKLLSAHVELHVVFYFPKFVEKFIHKGVFYYPVCKKYWKWHMAMNIISQEFIQDQDYKIYKKIIEDVKPDVIHIHGTENPFGTILNKTNIPVLLSIQGNITIYLHKFFTGIDKKYRAQGNYSISKLRNIIFQRTFLDSFNLFKKMSSREIRTLSKSQHVIGRTSWDKRISRIFAPKSKYFHVDEILRDPFYLFSWRPHEMGKTIKIHTTNGNSPYKGFETICHALSILNDLNYDVRWTIAGIAEDDLIVHIVKKQLGKNYPKKGLILLGKLNAGQLVEKMLESDIYVMPSHIENSPNNLCEAMILGMPCIATFAGGTGSMLEDGKEGILIQDGDPWAMAGAVLELKEDPVKAVQYGKASRIRALHRHDRDEIVNQLLTTYEQIYDGNRARNIL